MRQNNYGDIQHPDYPPGMLKSLKMTSAKLKADEVSFHRREYKDHQDEEEAVEYIEALGYWYDDRNRAWRYTAGGNDEDTA